MSPGAGPRRAILALATVAGAVLACAPAPPAAAQGSALERGTEALRTGRYDEAVRLLGDAGRAGSVADRAAAARALARALAITGRYDEALGALDRAAAAGVPAAELGTERGRVLREVGRDAEAERAFAAAIEAASSDATRARLERALLWWDRGERERAAAELESFIDLYNDGRARDAASLIAVGTAVRRLGVGRSSLFHDAVRAYEEALAADPASLEARLLMADLFLAKYDAREAASLLEEVLATNPRHPGALVSLARVRRFEGGEGADALLERALAVNARSPDARALEGRLRLEASDDAGAIEAAEQALAVHPAHPEALAVRAAARYFRGDTRGFEADRAAALERDPLAAGFHATVAELAARRGRYREAADQAERAVAVDTMAWEAWSLLGMNQLRIGELERARRSLERAFAGDPFNVWTKNTLDLMDTLDGFVVRRTPRFELVLHPDEADLLEPYVAAVAEEAYERLSARYGHRPEPPLRVEVYPRHADFSVRTMGLPGLGALGVAFGSLLAMDSPSAREAGTFHWGSTLWHEIAHAVTLGRTRHRVPRWLTEGISVREERRSRPGWGSGVRADFLAAFAGGQLLPLRRIDEGFVHPTYPGQVGVSYQHAGLVVELIEERHGEAALRRMLDAYAQGRDTPDVFRRVLGIEPEEMDARVASHVRERHGAGLRAVAALSGGGGDPLASPRGDATTLAAAARGRPDDFSAQLAAGRALLRAGRAADAEPFLDRARELFPELTGPGAPDALLAEARLAAGDTAGAVAALRRLSDRYETALQANVTLARLLGASDPPAAVEALERAIHIYPHDPEPHAALAELAARIGDAELEVRERRALVALRPVDRAGALYRLALAQRRAGDRPGARRSVLGALEIAPGYAEAQELLLELSGGGR